MASQLIRLCKFLFRLKAWGLALLFGALWLPVAHAQEWTRPNWLSAARLSAGFVLDPTLPLAHCDAQTVAAMAQSKPPALRPDSASDVYWTLFPTSSPSAKTQSAALTTLQNTPLWLIDEKGSRPVSFDNLVATQVNGKGPCLHLSSFKLDQSRHFILREDADVLVSTRTVAPSTRLVRARSASIDAFAQGAAASAVDRSIALFLRQSTELWASLLRDLPKPGGVGEPELCVPFHQPFNATLSGSLRPLVVVNVQWCTCTLRSDGVCKEVAPLRSAGSSWNGIVDRRNGAVWAGGVSASGGIQRMSVIGLATGGNLSDDHVWILEEYESGVMSTLFVREGKELKRVPISSYSGR